MTLLWILGILFIAAAVAWPAASINKNLPRWISVLAMLACFIPLKTGMEGLTAAPAPDLLPDTIKWLDWGVWPWIERFGVTFLIGMDGLSALLIILTLAMGIISVICSWTEIQEKVGFFHFNLLLTIAGVIGVFVALDLFLFFFFWEIMLIPMFLLIAIWGSEERSYASIKFFIFTQASSLLMLLSIVILVWTNYYNTRELTFNYHHLTDVDMSAQLSYALMLGFFIAFVVKLPAFPFHTWLPDAHTEAPTAGSVLLAAILLKTGAYGLIRFVLPIFPEACVGFAPTAMLMGVLGILYGAKLAFAQTDMKRLVAYSSVSHMGFVLIGIFALNSIAIQGAVMQMLAHGLSTAALFVLVGSIKERLHTRDMTYMGGFWIKVPRMAALGLFFAVASLGLPGLGNFIAEFLVLLGAFPVNNTMTILAALGLITAAVYSLILMQRVFFGGITESSAKNDHLTDYGIRECSMMLAMAVGLIYLGVKPQPVLDMAQNTIDSVLQTQTLVTQENNNSVVPMDLVVYTQ